MEANRTLHQEARAGRMIDAVEQAVIGQRRAVELAVCCFVAGGHLLIEDVPGVGKTTLARALARSSGGEFRRIQFTSDLLPTDIVGISVWNAGSGAFDFKPGPVFGNVVLADEINRATPKTQSALLEAMSERQVSVDGVSRPLPMPFTVIATQNAEEHHGTYPLPESQLDRFLMRVSMGYPTQEAERQVISRPTLADPVEAVPAVLQHENAEHVDQLVDQVRMEDPVLDYLLEIVRLTRSSGMLSLGVGPRGGMSLHRAARAMALIRGRDYCLVDDVKELAVSVLAHRVVPKAGAFSAGDARTVGIRVIRDIVDAVEIPL